MVEQSINRCFAAIHKIDDTRRQSRTLEEFKREFYGKRHALRWFENECVATRDGIRQEPEGDHKRKIEWSDGATNTEGLPNHELVDPPRHIFEVIALHQR